MEMKPSSSTVVFLGKHLTGLPQPKHGLVVRASPS